MPGNILRHNYLSLELPDDWEDASQVIALGPEDNGFRPNLVFSQEPAELDEDAAAFAARQLPSLHTALNNYSVVREQTATFGPNTGFLREHTFAMDKGEIGQFQFYVVRDGRAYTFTLTHKKERFERLRALGGELIAGARLHIGGNTEPDHVVAAEF